jgi:hypothetical protein
MIEFKPFFFSPLSDMKYALPKPITFRYRITHEQGFSVRMMVSLWSTSKQHHGFFSSIVIFFPDMAE